MALLQNRFGREASYSQGQAVSKHRDKGHTVNPVPRTYVRGFGALPLQGVQNIHPRAHARGVLWYGVNHKIASFSPLTTH
jgi:hypothetical protein